MQKSINDIIIFYVLPIILFTGIFGGIVNFFMNVDKDDNDEKEAYRNVWYFKLLKSIIIGLGGAMVVPLFLYIIDSQLIKKPTELPDNLNYLFFGGFCLMGAIFGRQFLFAVSENFLKRLKNVEKETKETKTISKTNREELKEVKSNVKTELEARKDEVTQRGTQTKLAGETAAVTETDEELYNKNLAAAKAGFQKRPVVANDIQKNQWGGLAERNNRKLSAEVTGSHSSFKIVLKVEPTNNTEMEGFVRFYLHQTFYDNPKTVYVSNNTAKLTLWAYGAFTVGAVCDYGKTCLELDLAELQSAPKEFREN